MKENYQTTLMVSTIASISRQFVEFFEAGLANAIFAKVWKRQRLVILLKLITFLVNYLLENVYACWTL